MEVIITIGPDGSLVVAVENQEGLSYEEAKTRLEAFGEVLAALGAPLEWTGETERHIHGPDGQHVQANHSQRQHTH